LEAKNEANDWDVGIHVDAARYSEKINIMRLCIYMFIS
jgi:hypothetical protein